MLKNSEERQEKYDKKRVGSTDERKTWKMIAAYKDYRVLKM